MVRNYKRRTSNERYDPKKMSKAIHEVLEENQPMLQVASNHNIRYGSLYYHIRRFKNTGGNITIRTCGHFILRSELEDELESYIIEAIDHGYSLSSNDIREFAYEIACANQIEVPSNWVVNKSAGSDWFHGFKNRHPTLSVQMKESARLARIARFHQEIKDNFFKIYAKVLSEHNFEADNIYNMDETGISVVARKETQLDGEIVTNETEELVVVAIAVSAAGKVVPPFLVYPTKEFSKKMIKNAPKGSKAVAGDKRMTKEIFLDYLTHFVENVKCSDQNKCLMIIDNHASHISLLSMQYAKENGIVFLMIPPHTSHQLQPLVQSIFGPFKSYINKAASDWMISNPEKNLNITHVSELISSVFTKTFAIDNIQLGFKDTGLYPYQFIFSPSILEQNHLEFNNLSHDLLVDIPEVELAEEKNDEEDEWSINLEYSNSQQENTVSKKEIDMNKEKNKTKEENNTEVSSIRRKLKLKRNLPETGMKVFLVKKRK